MRRRRLRKVLLWGFLFVASVVAGAIAFAYTYITDSDTLAQIIREAAPKYLPRAEVRVDRVQLKPLMGDVELKQTSVWQRIDGKSFEAVKIPWLQVRSDFRSLLWGKLATREVVVAQPRLRLKRRKDGSWNLQGLLADPWPQTALPRPVVTISKGTVELDDGPAAGPILRDVSLRVEPISDGSYRFEGDARGDLFETLALAGTFHPKTGRLVLTRGHLTALAISDALRNRLPEPWRAALAKLGLERGEVDVNVARLVRDPKAAPALDYEVGLGLRQGMWRCPDLPFPLADVAGSAVVTPRTIRVDHVGGHDGKTAVRLGPASFSAADPASGPMDLKVEVVNLELDERLRRKTPPKLHDLWAHFSPPGRTNLGQVNATIRATRPEAGAEVAFVTDVDFLDVAIEYHLFKYPLEHIRGKLRYSDKTIAVDLATVVGTEPLTGVGTIVNPGRDAVVALRFDAGTMPIDDVLLGALPPEARRVVEDFAPRGSVRGKAVLTRTPDPEDPKGKVQVHAELDLNEGCSIRWKGLPYPVRNLTGHLGLHPDRWVFTDMRGENNLAKIAASGRVTQVAKGKLGVDLDLKAVDLPFDGQLRESLPPAWGRTWSILNPTGTTDVAAHIALEPGRPDDYKVAITPKSNACVRLRLTPAPGTQTAAKIDVIELPDMEKITGAFVFDNGAVRMSDVGFTFRQAPVHFASGEVRLKDSGAFQLRVEDLAVKGLRLEHELRKIMPPVMENFARKLDDGKTFAARGNLEIGWTGAASEPAVCSFGRGSVVFNGNAVAAGVPLDHIQGEIRDLDGRFDGRSLAVKGVLDLVSVKIGDQHLTNLQSPLIVGDGRAALTSIAADLLGGKLDGAVEVTLDATPKYKAAFRVVGAKLEDYARTVPGHQEYKGDVNGRVELAGLGQDPKSVTGKGEAHVVNGDMGKLPIYLELIKLLKLPQRGRTVFDAADVSFSIEDGQATLDPIKFTSDAISLQGRGTISHLGVLDLWFQPGLGRDERLSFLGLSSAARELGGQLLVIHVRGMASLPKIKPEVLPAVTRGAGAMFRKLGDRRERR